MAVYEFRGFGVTRAVYSLTPDALTVELPGPQVGKSLHEARIPVASIDGFYVKGAIRWKGTGPTSAMQAGALNAMNNVTQAGKGELLLSWAEGSKRKSKRFTMVQASSPEFQALVAELARLRPGADLRALPEAQAAAKLGLWSPQKMSLVFIAAVIGLLLIAIAVANLVAPPKSSNERRPAPAKTR